MAEFTEVSFEVTFGTVLSLFAQLLSHRMLKLQSPSMSPLMQMSLVEIKPVFSVSNQVRHKLAYVAKEENFR